MGELVWHEFAHFVSTTAAIYAVWAGWWGIFYRKFFWDFVNGTFRDPGGLQPAKQDAFFVSIIVKAPVLQILSIVIGAFMIILEGAPAPLKKTALYRSLIVRVVALILLAVVNILYYQGVNAALYSLIAAGCYIRGITKGETIAEAKENRGKGGRA